jgi:hypothetical protein
VKKEIVYDLYDEYDPIEKISSMARTTGFTATATADMILNNVFNEKGMFPPENGWQKRKVFQLYFRLFEGAECELCEIGEIDVKKMQRIAAGSLGARLSHAFSDGTQMYSAWIINQNCLDFCKAKSTLPIRGITLTKTAAS